MTTAAAMTLVRFLRFIMFLVCSSDYATRHELPAHRTVTSGEVPGVVDSTEKPAGGRPFSTPSES
jgi:hypothetical protein